MSTSAEQPSGVTAVVWTDLRAIEPSRWITAVLKGTDTEVELVVLHHDATTGAAVSLVRFPAGLARSELGCYPAAEELAIIDGSLDFAGRLRVPGDYTYVPPRVVRTPMTSPDGLLVLAWFSGTPEWLTAEEERVPGEVLGRRLELGELRSESADVAGRTDVLAGAGVASVARDVLDIDGARWCFVPAGATAPDCDGPVQVRSWP